MELYNYNLLILTRLFFDISCSPFLLLLDVLTELEMLKRIYNDILYEEKPKDLM